MNESAPWARDDRWHRVRRTDKIRAIVDGSPIPTLCGLLLGFEPETGREPVFRDTEREGDQVREQCPSCEMLLALKRELAAEASS